VSRRDNAHLRCPRCRMHGSLCICDLIPRIETRTRLVLVIHRYEDRKPTNTGRLAAECLVNSEVVVRGHVARPSTGLPLSPDAQPLLLFPHEDAVPIDRFATSSRPVTLVVPDGSWRQASKVRHRVPGLRDVPCVCLPRGAPSTYRLRVDAHEQGLATIEAIARALRILEVGRGEEVGSALDVVFRAMVERTLWARGSARTEDVTGGIPEGAMRHDPRRERRPE
jgi:DTW domain-containing protein